MFEFKHPKYYKNLRKLYRLCNRDQAISDNDSTESKERAPGTGLKPKPAFTIKDSSSKQQASSTKLLKPQATSIKPQAQRIKRQAASNKLLDS